MIDERRMLTATVVLLGVLTVAVTAHIEPGDRYERVVSDTAGVVVLVATGLMLRRRIAPARLVTLTLLAGQIVFIRRLAASSGIGDDPSAVQYFMFQGTVLLAGLSFIALGPVRGLLLSGAGWVAAVLVLATDPLDTATSPLDLAQLLILAVSSAMVLLMFRLLSATVETMRDTATSARHVARLAYVDELTGLPNRRRLRPLLVEAVEERRKEALAVIMFDLDHFKAINDTFGHDVGDVVLQQTALVGQAVMREGDVLCRWGGEEFLALLPGATMDEAVEVAERYRRSLAAAMEDHGVTASFGVTEMVVDDSVEDLLSRVDRALYEAKRGGRNAVVRGPVGSEPQRGPLVLSGDRDLVA